MRKDAEGCVALRGKKEWMDSESAIGCEINVQTNRSSLGNAFEGGFYFQGFSQVLH